MRAVQTVGWFCEIRESIIPSPKISVNAFHLCKIGANLADYISLKLLTINIACKFSNDLK
jgi:hypothetical protein